MHKPTSSRGWLGGMRGAIKSAATVYGEHGRAKLLVRILSDSFQFLKGTKTGQAHSAGQPIVCHRLPSLLWNVAMPFLCDLIERNALAASKFSGKIQDYPR